MTTTEVRSVLYYNKYSRKQLLSNEQQSNQGRNYIKGDKNPSINFKLFISGKPGKVSETQGEILVKKVDNYAIPV